MSGDTPELEALFESIAFANEPAPAPKPAPQSNQSSDTPELEALFDSIAQAMTQEHTIAGDVSSVNTGRVFEQVGQMTRSLHNMLRELGYDKALAKVAQELPDNRDRLNYIAAMTAQAAEKTLNAAETAQPIQAKLAVNAKDLAGKWDKLFAKQLGVTEFKDLVKDTQRYLNGVPEQTDATNTQLMEIIMAQDFQDLTGQVIRKILDAAQSLEKQLVSLLLETTPEDKRNAVRPDLLDGPVVNTAGRSDVVTSQEQVDELLESLGF